MNWEAQKKKMLLDLKREVEYSVIFGDEEYKEMVALEKLKNRLEKVLNEV